MTKRNKIGFRPALETLEQRWVPATIRVVSGNLFITNPVNATITVQTTPVAGQIKITDGSTITVSGVSSLISITGNNKANTIVFKANVADGNKAFNGNLLINAGNGDDVIDLSGQIGGNVTIQTALGNDTVQSTSQDLKIGGSLTWTDTSGTNTFDMNSRNYTIGGNLQLTGVGPFLMGAGNLLKVGNNATISATIPTANPMTVTFSGDVLVGNTLQVTGGAVVDSVTATASFSVGGAAYFNMGGGNNSLTLNPTGGFGIGGVFQYQGGTGDDVITLGANLDLAGTSALYLGEGDNSLTTSAAFFGNLLVNGGNGGNTLSISGSLSGNLNLSLGNGTNVTTVNVVPAGTLTYQGGNGSDDLILRGVGNYLVNVTFGTGTNLLDIDQLGLFLSGTVRGTGGTNVFVQGDGELVAPISFINF